MKNLIYLFFFIPAFISPIMGQGLYNTIESPVKWDFKLDKINSGQYKVIATATMETPWVLYSQFTDSDGPIPTSFTVDGQDVVFKEESKVFSEIDDLFEVMVKTFKNKAVFSAILTKSGKNNVTGSVEFMTCDGTKCLPPTEVAFNLTY